MERRTQVKTLTDSKSRPLALLMTVNGAEVAGQSTYGDSIRSLVSVGFTDFLSVRSSSSAGLGRAYSTRLLISFMCKV